MIIPGTIILTNSSIPENNGHVGYWNHGAICLSETKVIEAIEKAGIVINLLSQLISHRETGQYMFLTPKNIEIGQLASRAAYTLAGTPYNLYSSLFPRITNKNSKNGLNCIGLIGHVYSKVIGRTQIWRFPDDILKSNLFTHSEIYSNV